MSYKCGKCGFANAVRREHCIDCGSPMSDSIVDQPPPKKSSGDIWWQVIADMTERRLLGITRYGTVLQAGNGRDALVDAYQEALDLCVYLRQAIEERKDTAKIGGEG